MPDALADLDRQRARILWSLVVGAVILVAAAVVLGDIERAAPVLAVLLIPSALVAVRRRAPVARPTRLVARTDPGRAEARLSPAMRQAASAIA